MDRKKLGKIEVVAVNGEMFRPFLLTQGVFDSDEGILDNGMATVVVATEEGIRDYIEGYYLESTKRGFVWEGNNYTSRQGEFPREHADYEEFYGSLRSRAISTIIFPSSTFS